ncbi:MAG: T9SS type A sorting domain-containing protein, partial [Cytophagales bacterium]
VPAPESVRSFDNYSAITGIPIANTTLNGTNNGTLTAIMREKETFAAQTPFPNPSSGLKCIPITAFSDVKVNISVADVSRNNAGEIAKGIAKKGNSSFYFDSSDMPAGLYIITIKSTSVTRRYKLMVRHWHDTFYQSKLLFAKFLLKSKITKNQGLIQQNIQKCRL